MARSPPKPKSRVVFIFQSASVGFWSARELIWRRGFLNRRTQRKRRHGVGRVSDLGLSATHPPPWGVPLHRFAQPCVALQRLEKTGKARNDLSHRWTQINTDFCTVWITRTDGRRFWSTRAWCASPLALWQEQMHSKAAQECRSPRRKR
jgi:hypothetical protein